MSTARSTSLNTSSEPYDFDSSCAVNGVLPQGAGSGSLILATRSALRSASSPETIRSARRAMFLAAVAFVALARILSAWAISAFALRSVLVRSRLRRRSSVSRWSR